MRSKSTDWFPHEMQQWVNGKIGTKWVNALLPVVTFLYCLKTSENFKFTDVYRGYKKETPGTNQWVEQASIANLLL